MGIKADPRLIQSVERYIDACYYIVNEEITNHLAFLGEMCVVRIRNRSGEDSWFDQTGNLRSSIGYAVLNEGRSAIASAFQQVLSGSEGTQKGQNYINELASKYKQTYALLVVAGMEYADKVEAMDNKDVLASTELWAKTQLDKYMQHAVEKATLRLKSVKI